ncbi:Calpain family cysteine protease [Entamoeba marina]
MTFVDSSFPADNKSLGSNEWNNIWLRPNEFLENPVLLGESIDGNDVSQGELGDCYFLSALSALADYPERIKKILDNCTTEETGKYSFDLNVKGISTTIVIDDQIPCHKKTRTPLFAKSKSNALWVMLIEKAYAKACGSYFNIEGGFPFEALYDLTGMPQYRIVLNSENNSSLYESLKKYNAKQYVMSANVSEEITDLTEQTGLIPGHSYSLVKVEEIEGNQLVQMRNPWGKGEWKGEWCDTDSKWTDELRNKYHASNGDNYDDGLFFIPINDFCKYFDDITIVRYKNNWNHTCTSGQLVSKQTKIHFNSQSQEVIFSLIQRGDTRIATRMWVVDEDNKPLGGHYMEAFYKSSLCSGKKVKLPKEGKYSLYIEVADVDNDKLPHEISIGCVSNTENIKFDSFEKVEALQLFNTPELEKNAMVCKKCGKTIPSGSYAKAEIGSFHIDCFVCSKCGTKLGENIVVRGDDILCPQCSAPSQ